MNSCGDCRWGFFHDGCEYGVCTAPAPAWAERAEPTVSRIGDGADYASKCPLHYPIMDLPIEKGGDNE